jgi:hypothetical protein
MSDPQEQTSVQDGSGVDAAPAEVDPNAAEIARSLGSVWQEFSGHRPKSTEVEIERDRVRCMIDEGVPEAETDSDADGDAAGKGKKAETVPNSRVSAEAGLGYGAKAAVARITGRRVVGFIPKRDKKTNVLTQTFILHRERRRY